MSRNIKKVAIVVGMDWHAPELKSSLENLGVHVTLITTSVNASPGYRVPMNFLLRLSSRFNSFDILTKPVFSLLAKRLLRREIYDLVFVWSSFGLALRNTPNLIVVRGNHHIETQYKMLNRRLGLAEHISIFLEKFDYKSAHKITVPTEEIASDPNWANDSRKLIVAPYGCPAGVRRKTLQPLHSFNAIFVGEFGYRKGADFLVKLLDQPDIISSFSVVGRSRFTESKLPSWWKMIGLVPKKTVTDYLLSADILILLSREEGMARVGLEAISHGLPVVVSPNCGLDLFVKAGCGVQINDPNSQEEFDSALRLLRDNFMSYGKECLLQSQIWTWEKHATTILENC
jgi:glycosyltransferase involved in cell wall biosynthesis